MSDEQVTKTMGGDEKSQAREVINKARELAARHRLGEAHLVMTMNLEYCLRCRDFVVVEGKFVDHMKLHEVLDE